NKEVSDADKTAENAIKQTKASTK
ncbi:MAG: hypothetical protein K940chlam4_00563, partial [Candidatus Anoxychlamydiales bacterium]|nr:hypothetical protein [Candidatus Anoxychlamydiales bacterium]